MRLLSRKENSQAGIDAERLLEAKLNVLRDALTKATNDLNEIDGRLRERRKEAEEELRLLRAGTDEWKKALENEVSVLEERRREAKKPLQSLKTALDEREKVLDDKERSLFLKASEIEDKSLALSKGFEDLADRIAKVKDLEASAEEKMAGARRQSDVISAQAKELNERLSKTAFWVGKRTKELEDRTNAVIFKEKSVEEKEKNLVEREKEDEKARARIASDRQTLKAAFEEGRKKGYL